MNVDLTITLAPVRAAMMEAARLATELRIRHQDIKCRPKCSACCNRYLSITLAEAAVIHDHLKRSKKWEEVAARAEALRGVVVLSNPMAWYKMGMPCPVLADDLCLAYQVRPIACSAHFVTSDPQLCKATSTAIGFYSVRTFPEVYGAFGKAFDAAVGQKSILRRTAPMPLALLFIDRVINREINDLDELVKIMEIELA
jgi:Fe-S-cluster containining protein